MRIRETAPGAVPVLPPFLLEPRFALRLSVSRQLWVSDLYSELRNHAISPIPAPRLATTTTESFNLRLPLGGCRRGQGPTNPIRWVRSTTQKKQLNDMSQLRIGEEWRLFRRQNVVTMMQSANLSDLHDSTHRSGSTGLATWRVRLDRDAVTKM